MLDGGGGGVRAPHAELFERPHVVFRDATHLAAHRGAEQPGAFVLWRFLQDGGQVLLEAHVQHLVRLIKHRDPHVRQVNGPAIDQVDQAAGRGHHHVRSTLDAAHLLADVRTAVYGYATHTGQVLAEVAQVAGDLNAQLARGCQHQRLHLTQFRIDGVKQRQPECGGLPGAGLGQGHHVLFATEQVGNGLLLDRRGRFETELSDRGEDLGPDTEFGKGGHGAEKKGREGSCCGPWVVPS